MKKSWRWRVAQYFESRWWKNYLKGKDPQEYLAWKSNYWNSLLKNLQPEVNLQKGQSILDAGCGPAGAFIVFPEQDVFALDPLIEIYEADLIHFSQSMYPNVQFLPIPLEQLNVDKRFDLVFCMNAINHVDDIRAAIKTLHDHIKPGGQLVMSIDAHNFSFLKRLFQMQPADILHPHQYDLAEYQAMLADLGMSIEKVHEQKKEFIFNHYVLVASKA